VLKFRRLHRLMMIKVAAVGGDGAGGEAAATGSNFDRFGQAPGWVAAEFGDVEEPAAVVGEQSV
jgi:hypothetical protein